MKLWQIDVKDESITLDMDTFTILRGHHKQWFILARDIYDFFVNRTTEVQIFEDAHPINKKEWECILLPYDISMQLDKVTSKSPLQFIIDQIIEILIVSPQYQTIIEEWEMLKEEEEIINKTVLEKFDLQFELKQFEDTNLKDFILLSSKYGVLTPLEIKMLFLKLIFEREITKRILLIIELPEIYAEDKELGDFVDVLNQLAKRGCNIIIITNHNTFNGKQNYLINNQVVNAARLEMLKNKVFGILPITIDDTDFENAKEYLLNAVDKGVNIQNLLSNFKTIHKQEMIIMYIMLKIIGIEQKLDTEGFPLNIKKFIEEY